MVGGMIRRDDGLPAISSTNIFSALESRRRKSGKKRSEKEKGEVKGKDEESAAAQVWTTAPVSVTSWADCEEDDDDYFALPALPPIVDQPSETALQASHEELSQESEEDEEIDDADDEVEEEEPDDDALEEAVEVKVSTVVSGAREPDRQLSKKEMKKKGLAELDAVLAELGLQPKDEKDCPEPKEEVKEEHINGDIQNQLEDMGSGPALSESKSSKRRKAKKEKPVKEERDEEPVQEIDAIGKEETAADEGESNTAPADHKEVLKKLASMKKKKSFKESDGAAKAAAAEAALRSAKLAAAKKKEKNHYNQQPVR